LQQVSQVRCSTLTPSSGAFQERASIASGYSAGTFISSSGLTLVNVHDKRPSKRETLGLQLHQQQQYSCSIHLPEAGKLFC